jgi:type III secretion system FlhB-like substrate exporter
MTETAPPPTRPQTLDDVMIAMDVVDTLRHREDLVRRELNEEGRESELIARLRQIYRDQGIEVPDHVLADGVKALKDSRFVYTPPPPGWKRTLLTAWVKRGTHGKRLGAALAGLIALVGGYHVLVARPAKLVEEQARVEIAETLPKQLRQAHADVLAVATDDAAKQKAAALLADGERAIRAGDRAAMTKTAGDLAALRDEVTREYTLTIVSRVGESTGVWRRPPKGSQARNYYLIVEAVAPDGRKLAIPVRNEETGAVETVSKFGVRVPEATFEAVARDKRDDGIVQRNRFGVKRRGVLSVDYQMPFDGGFITKW